MPSKNYDAQEMELNLADVFWTIITKWRVVIVCGVIFAVLAGGVGYLNSARKIEAAKHADTQKIELEGEALENANAYLSYWELYRKQADYNKNSLMMQLDGNGFYKATLVYFVDNFFVVEYPQVEKTDNIAAFTSQYTSFLACDEFYDKLPEVSDDQDKREYYSETIDFNNKYGSGKMAYRDLNLLSIAIYSADREECIAIAELVDNTIKEKKSEVTSTIGEHELILVRNECVLTADDTLLEYQNKNFVSLNTQRVNMLAMKKELTESEWAYVNQTIQAERDDGEEGIKEDKETEGVQNIVPTVSKKLVVVGFMAGLVLAAGILALAYLFRARLCLRDDFERLYGVKVLGTVVYENERKKLFGFIDRIIVKLRDHRRHYFEENEACEMIAAGVKITAVKNNANTVFVTGTNLEQKGKAFIAMLSNLLSKENITIVTGNCILYDPSALEKMVETGSVVLVEEAGKSLYEEIRREIETCCYHKIDLIGAVVVSADYNR